VTVSGDIRLLDANTNFIALLLMYPATLAAALVATLVLHRRGSQWARYVGISLLIALACSTAWSIDFFSDGDWDMVASLAVPLLAPVAAIGLFASDVDGTVMMVFVPLFIGVEVFLVALAGFAVYQVVRRFTRPGGVVV